MEMIQSADGHDVSFSAPPLPRSLEMPGLGASAPVKAQAPAAQAPVVQSSPGGDATSSLVGVVRGVVDAKVAVGGAAEGGVFAVAMVGLVMWRLSQSRKRMGELSSRFDYLKVGNGSGMTEAEERSAFVARYGTPSAIKA